LIPVGLGQKRESEISIFHNNVLSQGKKGGRDRD
jgi:hypothetical protein